MASSPTDQVSNSASTHRRETLVYIILPFAVAVLLVVAGVVIAMILPQRAQVSVIADLLLSVLLLCPAVVCLFPLVLLLITGAVAMNQVHDKAALPLRRVEQLTENLARRTHRVTEVINRKAVELGVKSASIERLLDIFEKPLATSKKDDRK